MCFIHSSMPLNSTHNFSQRNKELPCNHTYILLYSCYLLFNLYLIRELSQAAHHVAHLCIEGLNKLSEAHPVRDVALYLLPGARAHAHARARP